MQFCTYSILWCQIYCLQSMHSAFLLINKYVVIQWHSDIVPFNHRCKLATSAVKQVYTKNVWANAFDLNTPTDWNPAFNCQKKFTHTHLLLCVGMTFLTLVRKAKYIFNTAVWRPNPLSFAMNNKGFVTSNITTDSWDLNCVPFWHTPIWEKPELSAIHRHVTTGRVNFPKPCPSGDTNTILHFIQRETSSCFRRWFTILVSFRFVTQLSVSVVKVKLK